MVYDMMLSVADFDRLLDAGLIPVSRVPRTKTRKSKKGEIAAKNLGKRTFKTKDGTLTRSWNVFLRAGEKHRSEAVWRRRPDRRG